MSLNDELRELVASFGPDLLRDAEEFRAALDDFLPEHGALPGQLNVLYDAVRLGAYEQFERLVGSGGDPVLAVRTSGDALARERGTTEAGTSRWAVATLAHAMGHLSDAGLAAALGLATTTLPPEGPPEPPQQPPTADRLPSVPAPTAPAPTLPPAQIRHSTAPEAGLAVGGPPTKPAPPPLPTWPHPIHRPGRARSRKPAVLGGLAVAAVTTAAFVLVPRLTDEDSAGTASRLAAPTSAPTSSISESPEVALSPPGAPRVRATSAYRAVSFALTGPVVEAEDIELERRTGDGWSAVAARFRVQTRQGGREVCVKVRAVRTDGSRRKAGPSVSECGTSTDRSVRLTENTVGCAAGGSAGQFECHAYDLHVAGFASRQRLTMRLVGTTDLEEGDFSPCVDPCTKPLKVDSSGRGVLVSAFKLYEGTSAMVEVEGLRETAVAR
jgi:hypothetical protein